MNFSFNNSFYDQQFFIDFSFDDLLIQYFYHQYFPQKNNDVFLFFTQGTVLNYAYLDFPNQSEAPSPIPLTTTATNVTSDTPTDYAEVDWEKTETQHI